MTQLYEDFKSWVTTQTGEICHYTPLFDIDENPISVWQNCAVGCFARYADIDIEEVVNMLEAENKALHRKFDNHKPDTYEEIEPLL